MIALTAHDETQLVCAAIEAGASGYYLKGAPLSELRRAILESGSRVLLDDRLVPQFFDEVIRLNHRERAAGSELADTRLELFRKGDELHELTRGIVLALAAAIAARDAYTAHHVERVTAYALLVTERMAPELTADPRIEFGYLLHDIGKIGVPDAVLLKPGPLDEAEWVQMRAHVDIGVSMLAAIPDFEPVQAIVSAHHERWDGGGYPAGLRGDEIPLPARIFAGGDSFDAMTSDRPYRKALSEREALAEIAAGAGTQFDPVVVREFLALAERRLLTARFINDLGSLANRSESHPRPG